MPMLSVIVVLTVAGPTTPDGWIRHPAPPLVMTDAAGWPVVSDAGYVRCRDEGADVVAWTWLEWRQRQSRTRATVKPSVGYRKDDWGKVETWSAFARAVRRHRDRNPGALPLRIGHVSGEHGGFPDLIGVGYSNHLSHQTGQHLNLRLPVHRRTDGRVHAGGDNAHWDRDALLGLVEDLLYEGVRYIATNERLALSKAGSGRYRRLRELVRDRVDRSDYRTTFTTKDGRKLLEMRRDRDHTDHVNLFFSAIDAAVRARVPATEDESRHLRSETAGGASVMITTRPAGASIFVDGRYAGETDHERPLVLLLSPRSRQVRASRRGFDDRIETVTWEAGATHRVHWDLRAPDRPAEAVRIGTGHLLRGTLGKGERHRYVVAAKAGARRDLVLVAGSGDVGVSLRVLDGAEDLPTTTADPVAAQPRDKARRHVVIPSDGDLVLTVRARGAGGAYAVWFDKSPPPMYEGEDPRGRHRRLPGRPE